MKHLFILTFVIYTVQKCNSQSVASQKCTEYGKSVYVQKDSPVLSRSKSDSVSECGIVSVPLIVGGVQAQEKEFPHMALIGFGPSPDAALDYQCGGSLISDKFVLTAAHCLNSREKGDAQKVKLGIIKLDSTGGELQEKTVIKRIAHPEYEVPAKYHDIGLLHLDSPVQFTANVRPACLHIQDAIREKSAIASGFGKLEWGAGDMSSNLMKAALTMQPSSECVKVFGAERTALPNGFGDKMLCAGETNGAKDTCQGDSGGPLQIVLKEPYCMYSIVGITSFGKFCGFTPGIYTQVSKYIPWIESIVWA